MSFALYALGGFSISIFFERSVTLPYFGKQTNARAICDGQRSEICKRYREGQEDQLGALGLITNALVLWNTL